MSPADYRQGSGIVIIEGYARQGTRDEQYLRSRVRASIVRDHLIGKFHLDPPNQAEFVPVQSLWVDTNSLLPLRWELSQRQAVIGGFDFVYEPLDFQRPAGVEAPTCVN